MSEGRRVTRAAVRLGWCFVRLWAKVKKKKSAEVVLSFDSEPRLEPSHEHSRFEGRCRTLRGGAFPMDVDLPGGLFSETV